MRCRTEFRPVEDVPPKVGAPCPHDPRYVVHSWSVRPVWRRTPWWAVWRLPTVVGARVRVVYVPAAADGRLTSASGTPETVARARGTAS